MRRIYVSTLDTAEAVAYRELYPRVFMEEEDIKDHKNNQYQQRYSLGKGFYTWCTMKRFQDYWSYTKIIFK